MPRIHRAVSWVAVLICVSLCFSTSLLAQRADRGIISGVVADAQGSAVPGATVTVRNEATGVDTVLVTNDGRALTRRRRWCWAATR